MSQILGLSMLLYLAVAIGFVMAELWSAPRLQQGGRLLLWAGLILQTGGGPELGHNKDDGHA